MCWGIKRGPGVGMGGYGPRAREEAFGSTQLPNLGAKMTDDIPMT